MAGLDMITLKIQTINVHDFLWIVHQCVVTMLMFVIFQVYPMSRRPRGRAIIIHNDTFDKKARLPDREGSLFDVVNLTQLFEHLYFEVEDKKDLTAKVNSFH